MESPVPSAEEVRRIAAQADPALRNLRITLAYCRLSKAMARQIGEDTNWCTMATWASRQAGESIRGEDMLRVLEKCLGRGAEWLHPIRSLWRVALRAGVFQPETRLGRLVKRIHSPFDAFEQVSAAVARGNLRVFEEIAGVFARYLSHPDDDLTSFLQNLRPGPPPEGQQLLREAFAHYHAARTEVNKRTKAQLTLLGNLKIGLHEQTRLQEQIVESLEAPYRVASTLPAFPGLRYLAQRYRAFATRLTRRVITECLMELRIPPDLILGLGRDPRRTPSAALANPDLPELVEMLAKLNAAFPTIGTDDWGNFEQRMKYIANVFLLFHEYPELFGVPFNQDQIEQIERGLLPTGTL